MKISRRKLAEVGLVLLLSGCSCNDEIAQLKNATAELEKEVTKLKLEKKGLERKLGDALALKEVRSNYPDKREYDELHAESSRGSVTPEILVRYKTFASRHPNSPLVPHVEQELGRLETKFARQNEPPLPPKPAARSIKLSELIAFPEAHLNKEVEVEGSAYAFHGNLVGPFIKDNDGRYIKLLSEGNDLARHFMESGKDRKGTFVIKPIYHPYDPRNRLKVVYVLQSYRVKQ